MASEAFKNRHDNHPAIYEASTGEKLPVLAESLGLGGLAYEILSDIPVDPEDPPSLRRANWEHKSDDGSSQTIDLFEMSNQRTRRFYRLDVIDIRTEGYQAYRFGLRKNGPVRYSHLDTETPIAMPELEIRHLLTAFLRKKYETTAHGKAAAEWYAARYDDITGRFSAERVLSQAESAPFRVESQASDILVRRRAVENLFEIATRRTDLPQSTLASFTRGVTSTLQDQWRKNTKIPDETTRVPITGTNRGVRRR